MSDLDHRVGVKESSLVIRHLKLEGIGEHNKQLIIDEIDLKFGVDSVSFEEPSSTLHLAYDAIRCNLDGIEDIIRQHGADISHDWWTHLKEGYYQFVDQNIKDNENHQPVSCHKPKS